MSINRVCISGNLARDAELRQTRGGMAVLTFTVAVSDRRKDGDEWRDFTNWVSCVLFGRRAEGIKKYMSKGRKVAVEGKLRYSEWETDAGKRSKLEVIADEVEIMAPREQGAQPAQGFTAPAAPVQPMTGVVTETAAPSLYDADIPF